MGPNQAPSRKPGTGCWAPQANTSAFPNTSCPTTSGGTAPGIQGGLKGETIPWKARVIAIADAYDAMVTGRAYRKAISREEAAEEIRKNAGTQFDPEIAQMFIEKVLNM